MFRNWFTSTRAWLRVGPVGTAVSTVRNRTRDALPFLHILAGMLLVVWGTAPLTPWRIVLGLFVLYWVGWENLYTIGRFGIYMLADIRRLTGAGTGEAE